MHLFLILVVFFTAQEKEPKKNALQNDTPNIAFEEYVKACESGNWTTAAKRLSPGVKNNLLVETFFWAKEASSKSVIAKIDEIAEKYGIDPGKIANKLQQDKSNEDYTDRFGGEVMKILKNADPLFVDLLKLTVPRLRPYKGGMRELQIDGDKAAANVTCFVPLIEDGKAVTWDTMEVEIHFRRFDGVWALCTEGEWKPLSSQKETPKKKLK